MPQATLRGRRCPPQPPRDRSRLDQTAVGAIVGAGFGGIAAAIELQAPRHRRRHDPRAGADARRHVVLQQLPRRGLRRAQPPVLVLLRPAPRLVAAVLAAGGDPRLPAARSRARTTSSATSSQPPTVTACTLGRGAAARWRVETADGERREADALVLATGQLNQPPQPPIDGIESFAGHSFHSARWDHDYALAGKRVAVVGTGASAVQFVPEIARKVARLTVFQRTGNWFLPRSNRRYPRAGEGGDRTRARAAGVPAPASCSSTARRSPLAIRHPRTIGRLAGLRSARLHALAAEGPGAAQEGVARLHVRLQARAVQLGTSCRRCSARTSSS